MLGEVAADFERAPDFSCRAKLQKEELVPNSVLDAIKMGLWDFEPGDADGNQFDATQALPGSKEKLAVLAERIRRGLPLWHQQDRLDCENLAEELWPS
jgi:hypothetical protein